MKKDEEKQTEEELQEELKKQKNMTRWGIFLFWCPIVIAFGIGMMNSFRFTQCWIFGNCGADAVFGTIGLTMVIIGIILCGCSGSAVKRIEIKLGDIENKKK